MQPLSIIIPSAGLGRRMRSFGPKALLKLGEETILGRQLRIIHGLFPEAEIVLVIGFEAERVRRHLPDYVKVVENLEFGDTNVARSIGLGLAACSARRALVVYGDLVFNRAALLPFVDFDPEATAVLVDSEGGFRECEVGVNVVEGQATYFSYSLPTKWCQVTHLAAGDKALFQRISLSSDRARQYGFEILNAILERNHIIQAVEPVDMRATDLDTSKDMAAAMAIASAD